jgi:DNA-binding MarR family transcriptional regulator
VSRPRAVRTTDAVAQITARWAIERPELDTLPMAIFGRIARLHREQTLASERAYATLGINSGDFDVLATLRRSGAPYRLTPSQLTTQMMITSGGTTQRVDRLETAGLVIREPSSDDRRSTTIVLTDKGFDLINAALVKHLDVERELLTGLPAREQQRLVKLLTMLVEQLEGR